MNLRFFRQFVQSEHCNYIFWCVWFDESTIQRKITLKVDNYVDSRVIFYWKDNSRADVNGNSRVIFLGLKVGNDAKQ